MSLYLNYVLSRAGAPDPRRVVLLPYGEEWANRQIEDEFAVIFPDVPFASEARPTPAAGTLLVIPFMNSFAAEAKDLDDYCRTLSNARDVWVMLYGLRVRAISVLPATDVPLYLRRCRRAASILRWAARFRLVRLFEWAALRWAS